MDSNSVILNMPFDESNGSNIAYDYSQNRADGQVLGLHLLPVKIAMQSNSAALILARLQRMSLPTWQWTFQC